MKRARILLADDHPLTLEGVRRVLESDYEIVGAVTDGRALLEAAESLKPDLIVLDIAMPLLNGIDAGRQIRAILPHTKLLFVTMYESPAFLEAVIEAGGNGYVLKSAVGEELLEAVEAVLHGEFYLSPQLSTTGRPASQNQPGSFVAPRLSIREREILQLIAEGKLAKEIAFILHISVKTVAFHRENIKTKLGVRSTAELTKRALEQGLIAL
ncbi:MAG TPA: response regulator transcription factor [Bryobacteraceae bacterium]|nr:response regulator transcription factor [Bryobacteraceae bacterium]